jgi:hypothetical protein
MLGESQVADDHALASATLLREDRRSIAAVGIDDPPKSLRLEGPTMSVYSPGLSCRLDQ